MGWDDNGLPTERRVQNYYGVRCDPSLPVRPRLRARRAGAARKPPVPISRRNFVELCHRLTAEDEQAFEDLWRRAGLSVDWTMTYATIGEAAQRVVAAGVPAEPRPGRGVPGRGAHALGRRLPDRGRAGRARRPRDARRVPRGEVPAGRRLRRRRDRDHPARADPRVRRARRPSRRRALPRAVRHRGAHAAVPRPGAGARAPARRSREGVGHRDDLHVRRHHRRHLVARAAASRAVGDRLGRAAALRLRRSCRARSGPTTHATPTSSSRARRSSRPRRASSSC